MSESAQTPVDKFHDFICRCSDEGSQRADAIMAEVRQRLPQPESITDANFVGRVWDGTFKTSIHCDQVEDGIAATWKTFADRDHSRPAAEPGPQ